MTPATAPLIHLALVGPDRTGHHTLVWGYACGERATVLDAARADAASHDCPHPEALVALEVDAATAREIEDGLLDADDLGLVGDPPGEAPAPTPLALVSVPEAPTPAPARTTAPAPARVSARRKGPALRALVEACRAYYDGVPLDHPAYDPEACVQALAGELQDADLAQLQDAAQRAFNAALAAEVAA